MKIRLAVRAIALLAAAAATVPAVHAQDASNVRALAATCANCHGTDGRSVGVVPGLAGVDRAFLAQQMQDFKAGKRPATIMHQIARGYTDEQLEQLAGYFSSLRK